MTQSVKLCASNDLLFNISGHIYIYIYIYIYTILHGRCAILSLIVTVY
jgi:hypothetical protein